MSQDANYTYAIYVVCAILIVAYARERFNTPRTNRSSTRQKLYWASFIGYILAVLTLFAALCGLLQVPAIRNALLGQADDASLPAPLIATLAMTTLLSSVPILKRVDGWILAAFLDWGAIPAEVKRRAATLTASAFRVSAQDVATLRETYGDGSCGETLAEHLREGGTEGLDRSEYRLTRVVKLYDRLSRLAGLSRYDNFFAEAGEEFASLQSRTRGFLKRADATLTIAARLRKLERNAAYEELMHDRWEEFGQNCRDIFGDLAVFLARALLRSEPTETDIVRRLQYFGFEAAAPMSEPEFPLNDLTALAVAVYVYLGALSLFYAHLHGSDPRAGLLMALKITLARVASIGTVIALMQNFAFFRRTAGEPHKYFAYVLCGGVCGVVAGLVCLPFAFGNGGGFGAGIRSGVIVATLSGLLCAIIAFCCDHYPDESVPVPRWARLGEAAACAAMMVLGTSFVYYGGLLPKTNLPSGAWEVASWIALPSVMAALLGAFVPHIYRSARRRVAARQQREANVICLAAPRPTKAFAG